MRISGGPVTNIILVANVVIALLLLPQDLWEKAVLAGGMFSSRFTGGDGAFAAIPYALPFWLTPFSSAFLHGGLLHLLVNMLMLLLVGHMTERAIGGSGLAIIYFAGAITASLAEIVIHPNSTVPVIGASGAISALMAVYMMLFPRSMPKNWGPIPASVARPLQLLFMWTIINLLIGYGVKELNIAISAHIGGFIAGLLLARPILLWHYRRA